MRVGRAAGQTDTGRRRRQNEDAFVCEPPLFAVADGMGGAQAGELASRLAAAAIEEGGVAIQGEEGVAGVVRTANARIFEHSVRDPQSLRNLEFPAGYSANFRECLALQQIQDEEQRAVRHFVLVEHAYCVPVADGICNAPLA